mgnify:FL=1
MALSPGESPIPANTFKWHKCMKNTHLSATLDSLRSDAFQKNDESNLGKYVTQLRKLYNDNKVQMIQQPNFEWNVITPQIVYDPIDKRKIYSICTFNNNALISELGMTMIVHVYSLWKKCIDSGFNSVILASLINLIGINKAVLENDGFLRHSTGKRAEEMIELLPEYYTIISNFVTIQYLQNKFENMIENNSNASNNNNNNNNMCKSELKEKSLRITSEQRDCFLKIIGLVRGFKYKTYERITNEHILHLMISNVIKNTFTIFIIDDKTSDTHSIAKTVLDLFSEHDIQTNCKECNQNISKLEKHLPK